MNIPPRSQRFTHTAPISSPDTNARKSGTFDNICLALCVIGGFATLLVGLFAWVTMP